MPLLALLLLLFVLLLPRRLLDGEVDVSVVDSVDSVDSVVVVACVAATVVVDDVNPLPTPKKFSKPPAAKISAGMLRPEDNGCGRLFTGAGAVAVAVAPTSELVPGVVLFVTLPLLILERKDSKPPADKIS